MINVFNLANTCIQSVNKDISVIWRISKGYNEKTKEYEPLPEFIDKPVLAQVQALSQQALMQIEGLNIQGVTRSIWMKGDVKGVDRTQERGGDLLIFPQKDGMEAQTWKILTVVESWDTWAQVAAVLQNKDFTTETDYYGKGYESELEYPQEEPEEESETT